jgi:hypothetical protein
VERISWGVAVRWTQRSLINSLDMRNCNTRMPETRCVIVMCEVIRNDSDWITVRRGRSRSEGRIHTILSRSERIPRPNSLELYGF